MSLLELYVYLVMLPNLSTLFVVLTVLGMTSVVLLGVAVLVKEDCGEDIEDIVTVLTLLKRIVIATIIFAFFGAVLPNSSQTYLLAGAYAITNSEQAVKLPDNVLKAANNYLEKLAVEIQEEK